jgi:hypothetical protein
LALAPKTKTCHIKKKKKKKKKKRGPDFGHRKFNNGLVIAAQNGFAITCKHQAYCRSTLSRMHHAMLTFSTVSWATNACLSLSKKENEHGCKTGCEKESAGVL